MNLTSILQKIYPPGTPGPGTGLYAGECISFCHAILEFPPIGDSYSQKKRFVNSNGEGTDFKGLCFIKANIDNLAMGYRIGDLVITSDNTNIFGFGTGHGFIVADIDKDYLYAAESNFSLKKRVSYGRRVAKTDRKIYGIIRAPFKLNLNQCEINFSVLINNQPSWKGLGFLDELQKEVLEWTDSKLKINFFPLKTKCENWWYGTQQNVLDGMFYKIIDQSYLKEKVYPLSFTSQNKPSDLYAFIVRPDQWEGEAFGKTTYSELGWADVLPPRDVQIACSEFDLSPFYPNMRLVKHLLIHELSHVLHYINGMNDTTHQTDNQQRNLTQVFADLDFDRIKSNL